MNNHEIKKQNNYKTPEVNFPGNAEPPASATERPSEARSSEGDNATRTSGSPLISTPCLSNGLIKNCKMILLTMNYPFEVSTRTQRRNSPSAAVRFWTLGNARHAFWSLFVLIEIYFLFGLPFRALLRARANDDQDDGMRG